MESESQYSDFDIAIIGMAGRFPKAKNLDEYWRNLVDGTDCVTWFTREELQESGVEPELLDDPNYVPAAPVLEDADRFDAEFFGYSPKEAKSIDPQQRQLLECGWLAFENAGYDPGAFDGRIGVFAGTAMNTYFVNTGLSQEFNRDYLPTLLGSDKDFLATRLSYKLGLQGPALTIQTACSTSLVAIHYAIQSLLSGESDMTLVTAAAVRAPLKTGHLYEEASVFTKDGRCRAFDADATGTIFGSGVGGVILKQAVKAEADGDNIRAIIRGSAVNNDGNEKSDFTAPSVSMQAAAITEAMAAADVTADTIDYVEAHGTGTYLGDPIEVAALTQAYTADTDKTGFAKIGSVKSNVGHLDAAAGMASLIKVVLSLENEILPKTLHFEKPNPQIDFGATPFVPAAINSPWPRGERPRRAGITSLGMGGTNAHIIVEEGQPAAKTEAATADEATPALVLTAKTKGALDTLAAELGNHLEKHPDVALADVAYSLNSRAPLQEKRFVFGNDREGLIESLTTKGSPLTADLTGAPITTSNAADADTSNPGTTGDTVFLFTGQGSQRAGMGLGLYRSSEVFQAAVDRCAELFKAQIDVDIRAEMWPGYEDAATEPDEEAVKAAQARLAETWLTQPTLFTIEYALAQWWLAEGVTPVAMLGHSIGELTAAAVAEVMSLEHSVRLVSVRAQSMFDCEPGSMVAVEVDEETIKPLLGDGVELAVQNGKASLVLAGPDQAIERLSAELDARDLAYRALRTSHAFHTASMEPAAEKVAELTATMTMAAPKIPIISNVSGTWYSDADRENPRYWADQVRAAVRFSDGLTTLIEAAPAGQGTRAFLELGPAATLTGLVTAHPQRAGHHQARSTLPPRTGQIDDLAHATSTKTWLGVLGIGETTSGTGQLLRSLPGYPFGGKSHWFSGTNRQANTGGGLSGLDLRSASAADWLHVESFAPAFGSATPAPVATLIVGTGPETVVSWIDQLGATQTAAAPSGRWTADGFKELLSGLESNGALPGRIVYHWAAEDPTDQTVELLAIGKALTNFDLSATIELVVVTSGLIDPLQTPGTGRDAAPTASLALGPVRVINQEMETISARLVDVGATASADSFAAALAADGDVQVLTSNHRWTPQYLRAALPDPGTAAGPKKVVLVGGFGGIGTELAKHFIGRGDSVTLTSSRPVSDEHQQTISGLAADGRAHAVTLSFGDQAQVETAIASAADAMGGLDLIVHLGGVLDNGLLAQKDPDSARPVLYPKVEGSLQLLAAAEQQDAELVLFSSIAATHPEAGQVDYSAATSFQQALARDNNRVRAIAYPAWTGTGMTNLLSADGQAKAAVSGVDPASAIDAFDRFLASDLPTVIVSPIPLEHLGLARKAPVAARQAPAQDQASQVSGEGLTPTERKVAAIWNQLLGHDEIAATDQFPELGGTSLMAVKMFTQIDRQFGVELPVETVLEYPTLGDLAALLEAHGAGVTETEAPAVTASSGNTPASTNGSANGNGTAAANGTARKIVVPSTKPKIRVRVRPGDGPPVYLVHAHGGTVLSYERLARHLRKGIDVVGFQSQGIDGVAEPLTTIEQMADLYIAELREHQPEGPYHVGGFCMGGTIAWEMAAKLVEQGEEVSNLFMIQAFSREYPEYRPDAKPSWIARMTRDQLSLARLDDDGSEVADVDTKAKANALVRGVKSKAYTTLLRLAEPVSTGRRTTLNRIGRINDNAFWNYAPRQLDVDVVYLPATIQPEGAIDDPTLGFGRFHSGESIIKRVGGHFQGRFVEMDLESIADELNNRIDG